MEIIGASIVFCLSEFTKLSLCYFLSKKRLTIKKCIVPFDLQYSFRGLT